MECWNMVIDVALCENCRNCQIATKDEYVDNNFPGYSAGQTRHGKDWIKINRQVRGTAPMVDAAYQPTMCNHCRNAPCVSAGKGAVLQRKDGIVIIDPIKSKGRKDLVGSCPYGAISWNDELDVPQMWFFDAHLLDQGWKEPRCSQVCPTKALNALKVSDADMDKRVRSDDLEVLHPELGTKPRVYYKNLHRYNKCFIGGSVSARDRNGIDNCLSGAKVVLLNAQGASIAEMPTNAFGDFKFEKLEPASGRYTLEISHDVHGVTSAHADLMGQSSVNIGNIELG